MVFAALRANELSLEFLNSHFFKRHGSVGLEPNPKPIDVNHMKQIFWTGWLVNLIGMPGCTKNKLSIWEFEPGRKFFNNLIMGYIDGSLPCPKFFFDAAKVKINSANTHWMRQDTLIILSIVTYFVDIVITKLRGVETCRYTWDVLKTMYAIGLAVVLLA